MRTQEKVNDLLLSALASPTSSQTRRRRIAYTGSGVLSRLTFQGYGWQE